MKLNKKLIKQLRNGEIAVENSGTLEQLKEVLKAAFPDSLIPNGNCQYYSRSEIYEYIWTAYPSHYEGKPTFIISDFYQPELFTGWAKDDRYPEWMFYFKEDAAKFGFNGSGGWNTGYSRYVYSQDRHNRPATHEEIEKALIKEAKRRGYKGSDFDYLPNWGNDGCILFLDGEAIFTESTGQWAEIIEQPKPKTNPIHYTVDGIEYSLDYQELKAEYDNVVNLTDESFMKCLPQIAHLACIVAYLKGLGVQATISDKGIIHELIHLMTEPNEPTNDLQDIREKFNKLIQLV